MAGGNQKIEAANIVVPDYDRMGRLPLSVTWWSLCSALFYLFLAATLARTYGAANATIGILLSVAVFATIGSIFVRRAISNGSSVTLMSCHLFGAKGGGIATLLIAVTAIYYGVFEGSLLAVGITKIFGGISYLLACAIVVGSTIPLIFGGVQSFLDKFKLLLLLLYIVGIFFLVAATGHQFGWTWHWSTIESAVPQPFGWWHSFVAYMGASSLLMITADFAHRGRKVDEDFHAWFNFGAPFYLFTFLGNGLVGVFLVGTVQLAQITETAVLDATLMVLGGGVGLTFIWVTQTRINIANYYVAAINLGAFAEQNVGIRGPKWVWATITGGVIFALMLSDGVFKYLLIALQYQAIFICSWIGVALAAGALPEIEEGSPKRWRRDRLGSWLGGAACPALLCLRGGELASFAPPLSFLLSFGAAWLITRRASGRPMLAARQNAW